jgi:hypothetical protein
LRALSRCLERLCHETLPASLFAKMPVVRFRPERDVCLCGHRLNVQKTRRKTVLSMTTPFIAHETVLECRQCERVFSSEALRRIVPSHCIVAWDVLVFVGRSLFERHHSTGQVRKALLSRNVDLCPSEVDYLGQKFISYLALAHRQATPRITQALKRAGGYILHLDATHEAEAPALMTGLDSLSEFVLGNVKLPSEGSDFVIPFLKQLQSDYGAPIACVHDMGTGICKAVAEVFPDTQDYICHFHFLRDVGKDLIGPSYGQLRCYLRKHSATTALNALGRQVRQRLGKQHIDAQHLATVIKGAKPAEEMALLPLVSTYALALWCLHGKKAGDGYGFPFDRPLLEFARRLLILLDHLPELIQQLPAVDRIDNQIFYKLARKVLDIVQDPIFEQTVEELNWRCQLFDDLRKKMRIAQPGDDKGLNDEGSPVALDSIKQGVVQFRQNLDDNEKFADDALCRKVANQIDQYGDKLFADPIVVNSQSGPITIYPQRTNNILEQFFRRLRRGHRRRTGNNSMRKTLQAMLADTPLVKNLSNPAYMEILLDGKSNLEELFAEIEINSGSLGTNPTTDCENILPGFRMLAKLPNLPTQIVQLVAMA